jgi:hypothetical protein
MKALITAFALLSFVAASTVPVVAKAQTSTEQTVSKKKAKKGKKVAHKRTTKKAKKAPTA